MKKTSLKSVGGLGAIFVLLFMIHVPATWSQTHVALPFDEVGALDGAPYKIRVPANWNGTLLVWAHGYVDKADHPGEVDFVANFVVLRGRVSLEELLLSQGYALAGSAYKDNGYAVKEGIQITLALTNFFNGQVGKPDRIILWGNSMGSTVVLENIERYPNRYDGAIPVCTVGAGAPRMVDAAIAFALAYDVTFGWPAAWGQVDDIRNDLDFQTEVFPMVVQQVLDPGNFGRFEFIRLVNDLPLEGFYSAPNWLFSGMFRVTEAAGELARRARGFPAQNSDHVYSLTSSEKAYLTSLGVDADALLAAMNARRNITADPQARNYVEHYADPTGNITRPVLSLHTHIDGQVPAFHESAYRETVQAAGRADLLAQAFTAAVGHCAFSDAQLLRAVQAMEDWIETGIRPGPESFPAALGFLPDFEPPPFPYGEP